MKKIMLSITVILFISCCGLVFLSKEYNNIVRLPATNRGYRILDTFQKYGQTKETAEKEKGTSNTSEEPLGITGVAIDALNATPVDKSKNIKSEKEIAKEFKSRGFGAIEITSCYTMDGQYYEGQKISTNSDERHPYYEAIYKIDDENIWTITIINGEITAYPYVYNMNSGENKCVLFAESDRIAGYSSSANQFYEIIPDSKNTTLIKLDRIDATALRNLTKDKIKSMQ